MGRSFTSNRLVVEGFWIGCGVSGSAGDLGPWQTLWEHRRYAADGACVRVLTALVGATTPLFSSVRR
ncbi:hypothetical protein [Nocardia sp. NPDC047038]|uniref:hypothetical protein n=1 Tax=Nocardia sp. NPDC047038 TaxID=3154338 RepID=UPI00340006C5